MSELSCQRSVKVKVSILHGFTEICVEYCWVWTLKQTTDTGCVPHHNFFPCLHHRRGKEIPAKVRGVKKTPANRTQVRHVTWAKPLHEALKSCSTFSFRSGDQQRTSQLYIPSVTFLLCITFSCCSVKILSVPLQTSSPPPPSSPPKPSEEAGSTPEVATQQLNGSSAASAIGQPLELAPLAQPIPCALASRDNQSEGVEVEAPCCLDDCPSDGALQKEE